MDILSIFTHLRGDDGQWSGWERDELSRLKEASASVLENQIWEDGVTDNGDPWIVAIDEDSLELSLHVARLSGAYIAVSGDLLPVANSTNLKSVVNDCLTYIRSSRQETMPNDGATIRMPIGVSAAAFGIFLTERMTAFDEALDRTQTELHLSKLGPNPNESFVFLSNLATSPTPLHVDEPVALATEDQHAPDGDQAISGAFAYKVADYLIVRAEPAGEAEAKAAQEMDIASLTATSPETAEPLSLSTPHADQPTDLPLPKTDVAASVGAQSAEEGGAKIVTAAPLKTIVSEDKIDEEKVVDQPETGSEVVVASMENAIAASGSPIAPGEPSRGVLVEAGGDVGDTQVFGLLPLEQPQSVPQIEEAERLAEILQAPDIFHI